MLSLERDGLCNLVPFAQSKKREQHLCRSATLSKVAGFNHTINKTLYTPCKETEHIFYVALQRYVRKHESNFTCSSKI